MIMRPSDKMKAMTYTGHGSPDILEMKELDRPVMKDNELLVKVHAASLNALDSHLMRGFILSRLLDKLGKPKIKIPGVDMAGTVEAIGNGITKFKPGDEVFGSARGAFAEYVCATEDRLVLKPSTLSFESCAAVSVAALTALQGLRDRGKIKAGQKVLINGAGGGVGTFAVQIAKSFDTEVTAVCSTKNQEMARSIGADHVIDYSKENFTKNGKQYDLIFCANGYHSVFSYKRALSPNGISIMAGASKSAIPKALLQMLLITPFIELAGKKRMYTFMAKINQNDLSVVSQLMESGKVKPVIDKVYTLAEVPEAVRHMEKWHSKGKIIIKVKPD
jgi:NADPH:quinone reductase-like Zn-dependent oxidoreductase